MNMHTLATIRLQRELQPTYFFKSQFQIDRSTHRGSTQKDFDTLSIGFVEAIVDELRANTATLEFGASR